MAYEVVLTAKQFCDFLKLLPFGYASKYWAKMPYNCLYNHGKQINGLIMYSADCNNLVKATIWSKATLPKNKGEYAYSKGKYGLNDLTCEGLIASCSGRSKDFSKGKIVAGECMFIPAPKNGYPHIGTFVGEWTGKWNGKQYTWNTIEATSCWGIDGILATYTDEKGRRFDHKGGTQAGTWSEHGKLPWIDYGTAPNPAKETLEVSVDTAKYGKINITLK